ncbi:hypothetical protein O3P69_016335 [Scylla paramamosain]|uniref:Nbr1 FW domain-containing protein n=1 Tax=Scylla paramamosain TaxID=85552 RepID=A0AAW0TE66_SCYPA
MTESESGVPESIESVNHQQSVQNKGGALKIFLVLAEREEVKGRGRMEVDEDMEASLLRQFNCMLTTDKEVLVKELQTLVGANLNEHTARFYLEMTDWNLQAAVCAYFDLQSFNKLPQMTFVKDITIGEGESVPPSTKFIKTWRIQNTGEECWPSGCSLVYTGGEQMGAPPHVSVAPLGAGEMADISVEMVSPGCTGFYSSKWRMTTAQGSFYGDTIWVIIQVDSGGTLALMQQMVNLKELGGCPPPSTTTHTTTTTTNPFAPNQPHHHHHHYHHPNGNIAPPIPSSPSRATQEPLLGMQGPPLSSSLPNQDEDTGMS